ncbi:ATP-dependent Clp protease adaptor protein ClpS [Propioniferax innocua]|uniref:ATP-dependent Clp protease adapter protein ClpS n=2 Tax=Propioniferax innocua TaxID=1753 RepID=A0A542ZRQ8_9ACTN|nr:ATP-dependent Clp protease adaptor protein ClpS [Propioniferax innocua]
MARGAQRHVRLKSGPRATMSPMPEVTDSLHRARILCTTDAGGADPAGGTAVAERPADNPVANTPWVTIVWDDPVNTQVYVTHVFVTYFKYPRAKAERLMLQVHNEGKAVVASGSREEMERDVNAMHGFGLWATLDRSE